MVQKIVIYIIFRSKKEILDYYVFGWVRVGLCWNLSECIEVFVVENGENGWKCVFAGYNVSCYCHY